MRQYKLHCKTKKMFNHIQDLVESENAYADLLDGDACHFYIFTSDNEYFKTFVTEKFIDKYEVDLFGVTTGKYGFKAYEM